MINTLIGQILFSCLILMSSVMGLVLWHYARIDDIHIFERIIIRACACLFWLFSLIQVIKWVIA